jgi:predicted neuraminidase
MRRKLSSRAQRGICSTPSRFLATLGMTAGVVAAQAPTQAPQHPAVVQSEFVYTVAPKEMPSVHASTIIETSTGLVAAWFGGTREGANDVGIWVSRKRRTWSTPVRVATGLVDRKRNATWNPVLFETTPGEITLFYKVGPNPREWWGMKRTSRDGGVTWSPAVRLPKGQLGPIKNKPIRIGDGLIVAASSTESMDTPPRWRVHFERSVDQGKTWNTVTPPMLDSAVDAIQPTLLSYRNGWLQALTRSQSGRIYETWSPNRGLEWSPLAPTSLPNPNAGIDAITLNDRRQLLVYNHTATGRVPLNVSVSNNGVTWTQNVVLESAPGEYSYPAVIQTSDSLVHITYTWKRTRIKHVVLDPRRLRSPRNDLLDSLLATMTPKLSSLVASRDSLELILPRDSASSRADSAVWRYRESAAELLKTATAAFDDSVVQHLIYPADSARRARVKEMAKFVPPDFAMADSLTRFLDARGVWAFRDEGATYFALSERGMLRSFGPYVREGLRSYLRLETLEQTRPAAADAALAISLDELADRLAAADSVADRFRGTIAWQQIDWRRAAYLSLMINGTDNSPAFTRNSKELRAEFRSALERFANRRGVAISGKVVRDYLTLLRASEFKETTEVNEYRQRVRESAGPRG